MNSNGFGQDNSLTHYVSVSMVLGVHHTWLDCPPAWTETDFKKNLAIGVCLLGPIVGVIQFHLRLGCRVLQVSYDVLKVFVLIELQLEWMVADDNGSARQRPFQLTCS